MNSLSGVNAVLDTTSIFLKFFVIVIGPSSWSNFSE